MELTNDGQNSFFDGGLLQQIGLSILAFLMTFLTLGIAFPWAICLFYNWEVKHTVINGKRLHFEGNGLGLFNLWIKWFLLSIITFGIYSLWIGISLRKWKTKHTHF